MNISKVNIVSPNKNIKRLAAAVIMGVGVLAGASAATKINNKNNNITPPTNVETVQNVETKKENPFKDFFINLGLGTAVIAGVGVSLIRDEMKHAKELNNLAAKNMYNGLNGNGYQPVRKDNTENPVPPTTGSNVKSSK